MASICLSSLIESMSISQLQELHSKEMVITNYGEEQDLVRAVEAKDAPRIARFLLEGADPNATLTWKDFSSTYTYDPILRYAVACGDTNVVKALLGGKNIHVNACGAAPSTLRGGYTALSEAVGWGAVDITQLLLMSGADPNLPSGTNNDIPLVEAAMGGHKALCCLLLDYKADPNIATSYGSTPLTAAAYRGHVEVCQILFQHHADPNATDGIDITPLMCASQYGHVEVCKVLIRHQGDPNAVRTDGFTPLMMAAQEGHVEVCKVLLQHQADPNAANNDGFTPLLTATQYGHVEVCQILLQNQGNPDAANSEGTTPLILAAELGHVEVCQALLQHQADSNVINNKGATSMMMAAQNGHKEVIQVLLDHGADPDIQFVDNGKNFTAVDFARGTGHTSLSLWLAKQRKQHKN